MRPPFVLLLALAAACSSAPRTFQGAHGDDVARWQREAWSVTIIRDDWGIAHVYGKTDADAVFGAEYAQAEDDFNRVETNYINAMGRLAEAEGEGLIWQDLRMKLFIEPEVLRKDYASSPVWLRQLMDAFADGLNYYLYTHPEVKPRVIARFEPWMALSFTEGSIGGDFEHVSRRQLRAFYREASAETPPDAGASRPAEPGGSNGIAVAPANTTAHHALLLINPHTSFFFRSELQMVSEEGLNAYGAATWGQFFIYQGFNEHVGWMHTSSAADATDEFLETVEKRGDHWVYTHGGDKLPLQESVITVPYTTPTGMAERSFTVYRTQHGPIVREQDGKWVAFAAMNEPVKALMQSYTRTKATDYGSFRRSLELHTNSSNNTVFADAQGDIAYFHGNYIPRRDPSFDWTRPVDGSNPATDYRGLLSVDESPHLLNPASGWIYNCNDSPWQAAGESSPKKSDFPPYVDSGWESARGRHAVRVLESRKDFTLDGLVSAAFDSYLTWFEKPIPALANAWDASPADDPLKEKLREPIGVLRSWDLRWGADSVATSVAVFWGEELQRLADATRTGGDHPFQRLAAEDRSAAEMPQALSAACDKLAADFGTWRTPWGEINRFQRLNDDMVATFDDSAPSIPVPFTSAKWGSLASFGARAWPNTKKWYATSGNSFVAVVELGPTVRARAVTAGGESGDPASKHFDDEVSRYATGNLREVYFYPSQLAGHIERQYHPGR